MFFNTCNGMKYITLIGCASDRNISILVAFDFVDSQIEISPLHKLW